MGTASWATALVAATLYAAPAAAQTAPPAATRGELLYSTHCIACHTQQVHWREQKLATDWRTLKEQVDRWQQRERLGWPDDDITEVARHLNDTVYGYPREGVRVGRARAAICRTSAHDSTRPASEHAPVASQVNCQPPALLATQATSGGPAN